MGKAFQKLNNILSQAREKQIEKEESLKRESVTIEEVIRRYEEILS
jgi:hypothetical protein